MAIGSSGLSVSGLRMAFGTRVLFDDVTFSLNPGRRTALVGGNGAGKTTLLEILLGHQRPEAGTVTRPRDQSIGFLPQDLADTATGTVMEETLAGKTEVTTLARTLRDLEAAVADPDHPDHATALQRYGDAQSHFEQLGGYALEAEAHRVLAGLGFAPDAAERPVRELSGGWRMRVALARLLLADPDLLLLDEPTNHLDVDSEAFLEQHLLRFPGALLFVSHDRDFIDAVADRVIDLSEGTAVLYEGGFAEFVVGREERLAQRAAAAASQARQVASTERFIERFRYKATKARQVQSRVKTLQKLERIEMPTVRELRARFAFPAPRRSSRVVVEAEGAGVGFDGTDVLSAVDLVVERGRKVALVGPNGAGKTTLVRLLTGDLEPGSGRVVLGTNVDVAMFEQHQADRLDPTDTVYDAFRRGVSELPGRNLRTLLGSFGFPGDSAERRVGDLSGGERTRLALARVMADPVNLLVLDEPTNHLDLPSCDLLEDALRAYPGTLLLVTHDRYLIREVADALVEVRGGTARWHEGVDEAILTPAQPGGPTESPAQLRRKPPRPPSTQAPATGVRVQASRGRQPAGTRMPPSAPADTAGPSKRPGRASQRRESARQRQASHAATKDLKRRVVRAEKAWAAAEEELAEVQRALADPATYDNDGAGDRKRVETLSGRHDTLKDRIAELMAEWEDATAALEDGG